MKKVWKRFEEWAIALRSNIFAWARIKLTALYVLIILFTLAIYSAAMYVSLVSNIRNEVVETADQLLRHQIYEAAVDHIQFQIFIIDLAIFVIATIGSYVLAGVTLSPIKRALEAQEAFSADASHELRTPLAVMKTDIEVLLRSKETLSEPVQRVLQSNLEEINTLSTMTSDLLELSRGKIHVKESVVLSGVVQEEVQRLQSLALQKKITVSFDTASTQHIEGDRLAFARVFKNIIANAVAYTPEGGLVSVVVRDSGSLTVITVSDTGSGIAAKDVPHIFKRFYKADNARSAQGTGLGLALAKDIVDRYHGSIVIESVLHGGTIVTVIFPTIQ